MAYMTFYSLRISAPEPTIPDIACLLADISDRTPIRHRSHETNSRFWESVLGAEQDSSWYDHETHMRSISAAWPTVLFTLAGRGDEPDDQWVRYHLNGKMHKEERGEWTPPPFDPDKLE